jgi:hypothetical protein
MAFGTIDQPSLAWEGARWGKRSSPPRFLGPPIFKDPNPTRTAGGSWGPSDSTYWDSPSALGPPGVATAGGSQTQGLQPGDTSQSNAAPGGSPLDFLSGLGVDFSNPMILLAIAAGAYFLFFKKGR